MIATVYRRLKPESYNTSVFHPCFKQHIVILETMAVGGVGHSHRCLQRLLRWKRDPYGYWQWWSRIHLIS